MRDFLFELFLYILVTNYYPAFGRMLKFVDKFSSLQIELENLYKLGMPELPEVETVARELNRALRGQKILAVKTSWPGPILQNTSARDIGQFLPDREAARRSYLESTSPMPRQRNGRNWPYPFGVGEVFCAAG